MKRTLIAATIALTALTATAGPLFNASFEDSNVDAGLYKYSAEHSTDGTDESLPSFATFVNAPQWNLTGNAAIVTGRGAWGKPASDGEGFAVLQNTSAISQTFTLGVLSKVSLAFDVTQRTNWGNIGMQTMEVELNNKKIWDGMPSMRWSTVEVPETLLEAGDYTLTFKGTNGWKVFDTSAFVDNVRMNEVAISAVPEPSTYTMMLAGLLGMGYIARRKQKQLNSFSLLQAKHV